MPLAHRDGVDCIEQRRQDGPTGRRDITLAHLRQCSRIPREAGTRLGWRRDTRRERGTLGPRRWILTDADFDVSLT